MLRWVTKQDERGETYYFGTIVDGVLVSLLGDGEVALVDDRDLVTDSLERIEVLDLVVGDADAAGEAHFEHLLCPLPQSLVACGSVLGIWDRTNVTRGMDEQHVKVLDVELAQVFLDVVHHNLKEGRRGSIAHQQTTQR